MTKFQKKLWMGLLGMALLTPLGLLLPEIFDAGTAWGEWDARELAQLLGFVPQGLERLSELWKAPFSDYAFNFGGDSAVLQMAGYALSGLLGILICGLAIYLLSRFVAKNEK